MNLPLLADKKLSDSKIELLADLIRRRASREPLQYVLGNALFADLDLKVDARVLIPRPETEDLLSRIVAMTDSPGRILDLGTGSGALALGLAFAFPKAEVIAVDKSPAALTMAAEVKDSAADLKRIVIGAQSKLREGGVLFLETGENHHPVLVELASAEGYVGQIGMSDMQNRPRFFLARCPN